jgi:nicotinamidase-related amidase
MLMDAHRSLLLVVDMQEKLLPAIHDHERVTANAAWLIGAAQRIDVPVAATEQYPKGLGRTAASIKALLPAAAIAEKTHFSCVAAKCLPALPGADRPQVVVLGVEAHVCVLQTALELMEEGREVYVVADCVGSRRAADRDVALTRMRGEGVRVVTREMVVFEWLGEAGTPLFKAVSRDFLKGG